MESNIFELNQTELIVLEMSQESFYQWLSTGLFFFYIKIWFRLAAGWSIQLLLVGLMQDGKEFNTVVERTNYSFTIAIGENPRNKHLN